MFMKTNSQFAGILGRYWVSRTVIMASGVLLALAWNTEAASKSGGGTASTQPIVAQFWLDDFWLDELYGLTFPNGLVADGNTHAQPSLGLPFTAVTPPYKDGIDYVGAQIGRDQSIYIGLAIQKKPAIRFFQVEPRFPIVSAVETVFPGCSGCAPSGVVYTSERPVIAHQRLGSASPQGTDVNTGNTMLAIYGLNFDDMPPGTVRHVDARLTFSDDNATVWALYYGARVFPGGYQYAPHGSCMVVQRLSNVGDKARWRFSSEAQLVTHAAGQTEYVHAGYLYKGFSSPPVFAGVVNLSLSSTIESLSSEPEPWSVGYAIPENPPGCPLQ